MTSVRKRGKRISFAREFPPPTPEESERIRQESHDGGHCDLPDHVAVNWVRELNGDEARLAEVSDRLAALKQHLPGMSYEQARALDDALSQPVDLQFRVPSFDADEEEPEPDSPAAQTRQAIRDSETGRTKRTTLKKL
jgi:hypothetical protein